MPVLGIADIVMEKCHACGRMIDYREVIHLHDMQITCRLCHDRLTPICPYCREQLPETVKQQAPCPNCGNTVFCLDDQFIFDTTLLTCEQADAVEDFHDLLTPRGIPESEYRTMEQILLRRMGRQPTPTQVIEALLTRIRQAEDAQNATRSARPARPDRPDHPGIPNLLDRKVGKKRQEEEAEQLRRELCELIGEEPDTHDPLMAEAEQQAEADPVADAVEIDPNDERLARAAVELLAPFGADRKTFATAEQTLKRSMGHDPSVPEIIHMATKLVLAQLRDKQAGIIMLSRLARVFHEYHKNPRPILVERAKTLLKSFNESGVKRVRIEAGDEACLAGDLMDGREYKINDAMAELPIPHRDCKNFLNPDDPFPFCICDYSPVAPGTPEVNRELDAIMDDDSFSDFLGKL